MEETECIVCFSHYDEEEHRPRVMPCGHTLCSDCLERAIREDSKMCPKCRARYSASNVDDLSVNFSLMLQTCEVKGDHLLGYLKLTERNGKKHLHVLHNNDTCKSLPSNFQDENEKDDVLNYDDNGNEDDDSGDEDEDSEDEDSEDDDNGDHPQIANENDHQPQTDGILTFMDIALPDQEPRRVYMKMLGNTLRARQHLLLVTGQCGHSYKNLKFKCFDQGLPDEFLEIYPYDGKKAAPLFKDVRLTDDSNYKEAAGLMTGAHFEDDVPPNYNNGLFGIFLRDYHTHGSIDNGFGIVTSGLEVLQDVASSEERDKIKVVDCGLVLLW